MHLPAVSTQRLPPENGAKERKETPIQYLFGDCLLDPERRELRRAGVPVPVERKVYQVLAYLVQHADRLVPKAELLDQVWPNVYVTDKVVARCIAAIRRAVGDSAGGQRVIQTVHGEGYRFVASVAVQAPLPPMRGAAPSAEPSPVTVLAPALPVTLPPVSAVSASLALPVASLPAPSGERKLVTVLSCSLVKTAAMAEGIDPEDQHHLLQAFFAHATAEVRRYGGTIAHLPGDGFVALFGAPVTYEDHAQRAVLAAVGLRTRSTSAGDLTSEALAVCMGLHTGLVVIGMVDADVPWTSMAETP